MQTLPQPLIILVLLLAKSVAAEPRPYDLGIGKADVTGPAAGVGLMGYGRLDQVNSGLINRLYARAFIVANGTEDRMLFIHTDLHSIPQVVHTELVQRISNQFDGVYNEHNIVIHAQHTHSSPGGLHEYFLFYLTTWGFNPDLFDVVVAGVLESVDEAHASLAPGTLLLSRGTVQGIGKQRSEEAYMANPPEERALYPEDRNPTMTNLEFYHADGSLRGVLNFYAVHPTSLIGDNNMVSSDNKGYAEWVMEKKLDYKVVVAFAQIDSGDVSPNTVDNGDGTYSGEGRTYVESCEIVGKRQADAAEKLLHADRSTKHHVTGDLRAGLDYVNFSDIKIDGVPGAKTCPAVIGQAFIAGTEDGRGIPAIMKEGNLRYNAIIHFVGERVFAPIPEHVNECQLPKHPAIGTGVMQPLPATPEVLPIQVLQVGSFGMVALPFEVTTMAGRRLRKALQQTLARSGVQHVEVVGLSNAYAGYLTTKEEYDTQHYEGASTHFGPYQLHATIQEVDRVAKRVVSGDRMGIHEANRPRLFDDRDAIANYNYGVWFDLAPNWDQEFGRVSMDARDVHTDRHKAPVVAGKSIITATFWGAHPKNRFHDMQSLCDVERLREDGTFETVLQDGDWNVRYYWRRRFFAFSLSNCEWTVDGSVAEGTYRIVHRGFARSWDGDFTGYAGASRSFHVHGSSSTNSEAFLEYTRHEEVLHYMVDVTEHLLLMVALVLGLKLVYEMVVTRK